MAKSREAFRTISEVSEWLETPAHVLRFWESRFTHIKPVKRAGGRRYYRPSDMLLLGGIKRLLHDDGITIKGVQKILREKGVKYVSSLSLEAVSAGLETEKAKSSASENVPPAAEAVPENTPIEAILDSVSDGFEDSVEEAPIAAPQPVIADDFTTDHILQDEDRLEPSSADISADEPEIEITPKEAEPAISEIAVASNADESRFGAGDEPHLSDQPIEERATALYYRLAKLRDRMKSEMHAS